tara:strand:+ start:1196 stop:1879 length:684 start_codon:yes stop_codon:yes gene_type:complete
MLNSIAYLVGFLLLAIILFAFVMIQGKSQRLRVYSTHNKVNTVKDYWVTEKKDKNSGVIWWRSLNGRIRLEEPPADCIDIGLKGKKHCTVERLSEDEYAFIKKTPLDKNDKVIREFRPFTTTQRNTIVSQFIKAEEMKNKNWIKDAIVPVTSIIGLVIIVVMLLVYWGDIAKPALDSHALALDVQEQNIRIIQGLQEGGIDIEETINPAPNDAAVIVLGEGVPDGQS